MAKTFLDIQNSAYTVGNIMDWTNALTRLSGVPVDITEVYDSYDKAVEYAAINPVAYEGQLITVTENGDTTVYVITPAVQGTYVVGEGDEAVTYNVNIKKVGTVPSGDNASITVTEAGLVSLYGFANAENGKLPMKVDGAIVWKSLEDIGAGDGNDDTTYIFELNTAKNGIIVTPLFNGQPIMEGEEGSQTQKKFEIVLDVYTKAEADEKFLAKADYTPYDDTELEGRVKAIEDDYLKAADKYDDTDVKARLDVIEGDYLKAADKYDDTALAGRVKALEDEERYDDTALKGRVETLETASADHETRIGKVEDFFKTADGESLSEAMDTLIEIQKEIASDNEGAAAMLADIQANTDAIGILNGDATTVGSVDKKIADAVAPLATTEALNGVKSDIESDLALKADADKVVSNDTFAQFQTTNTQAIAAARSGAVSDVETKGYAVATEVAGTYATKQELTDHSTTMATTLNDYAKKAEVEEELAKKIENASIAHTTETQGEEVKFSEDGKTLNIFVDAYTKAETLQKIEDKITEINGGESAGEVLGALNSYKESNDLRVGAIETKNTEQDTAITAAQTQADKGVADAKIANDAIATINSTLGTHGDDITAVKGRLTTLETAKGDHETRIAAAEGEITALSTADSTINTKIGTIEGNITALTNEDARLAGLIQANTDKFADYATNTNLAEKADKATTYTKTEVNALLENLDQTEINAAIKANSDAIAILIGTEEGDKAKSVRAIAKEEVELVVGAAPEAMNTLEEVANWIANDQTGAAAMAGDIADLKTQVSAANDAIAAIVQPKASNEVTVATDGTLGIGEVNVSKLVQTEGDVLILCGGNAGKKTNTETEE